MPLPPDSAYDSNIEASSTPFQHLTKDDLLLVRLYEPSFLSEVDRALSTKRPVHLQLNGHESNKDIIAACLWYALDHGVKVVVTTGIIENIAEQT